MANLASSLDPSILGQVQNFNTVNKADKQAQLVNQAAQIDNASKANIYKTQVLSAAVASGDPRVINSSLQGLNGMGIDTSDVPTDPDKLAAYVQAGRLAQSPLGSLLNAQLKDQSNQIQAAGTMGSANQSQFPSLLNNGAVAKIATAMTGVPVSGTPTGLTLGNPTQVAQMPPQQIAQQPITQQSAIDEPANMGNNPPEPPIQTPAQTTIPKFSPPPQQAGETNTAYNQRVNNAFESYKADPNYLAAAAAASQAGKDNATTKLEAIRSDQTNQKLQPNFDALRAINNQVPDNKYGVPYQLKEYLSAANPLSDSEWASAAAAWKAVNEQQVLNSLAQLTAGGQIRPSRQIAKMLETGNFVPEEIPPDARLALINTLASESKNSAISAGNINAQLNGGQTQPYVQTMPSTGIPASSNNYAGFKYLGVKK